MKRIEQRMEEFLELLWMLAEDDRLQSEDRKSVSGMLQKFIPDLASGKTEKCADNIMNRAVEEWLVAVDESGKMRLTTEGEERAKKIVRRHRLAEVLLTEVLDVPLVDAEESACQFEHFLNPEVTESVCTFLGHPRVCPHGKKIPPGECCSKLTTEVKPLVMRLADLGPGDEAKVFFITSKIDATMHKLASLGMVPGAKVKLHQKSPSFVVSLGETQLALDAGVVSEVFVKRVVTPA